VLLGSGPQGSIALARAITVIGPKNK